MAKAFYNKFTGTNDADSAGIKACLYPEKRLSDFVTSTNAVRVMKEVGIDMSDSCRQQLTKDLVEKYDLIINVAPQNKTPGWLKKHPKYHEWQLVNLNTSGIAALRLIRDEIETRVYNLVYGRMNKYNGSNCDK